LERDQYGNAGWKNGPLLRNDRILDLLLVKYSRVLDKTEFGRENATAGTEMGIWTAGKRTAFQMRQELHEDERREDKAAAIAHDAPNAPHVAEPPAASEASEASEAILATAW
jgi:hypothetical protein